MKNTKMSRPTVRESQKLEKLEQTRSQLEDLEAQRIEADRKLREATSPNMPALSGNGWVDRH